MTQFLKFSKQSTKYIPRKGFSSLLLQTWLFLFFFFFPFAMERHFTKTANNFSPDLIIQWLRHLPIGLLLPAEEMRGDEKNSPSPLFWMSSHIAMVIEITLVISLPWGIFVCLFTLVFLNWLHWILYKLNSFDIFPRIFMYN